MMYLIVLAAVLVTIGLTMLVMLRLVVKPQSQVIDRLTHERDAARRGLAIAAAELLGYDESNRPTLS